MVSVLKLVVASLPTSLNVVRSMVSCEPMIEAKGLRLQTTFDGTLGQIVSNRLKLKQIALNLLTNAAKYTLAGKIELGMSAVGDERWLLRVADTGRGMPPAVRDSLFKNFARTTKRGGTGLGTKIVHDVVAAHGGRVEVDSELGRGTTFSLWLPMSRQ